MTQTLELAQHGDPKAIAALMSRHLTPQGITVKVAVNAQTLQILLDGIDLPNQVHMSQFISQGIGTLAIPEISTLEIFGKRAGEDAITWISAFSKTAGNWEATETPQTTFGADNLILRCQQGDLAAIQQFASDAVAMLVSQLDPAADNAPSTIATFVELDESGLLTVTLETKQFLNGPAFAADLGQQLNAIASLSVKEVALYKRKTSMAQPFLIKRMTLQPPH